MAPAAPRLKAEPMEQTRSSLTSAAPNQVRPGRRWLQFSLRSFLIVLTIGCLWLGWKVERARRQRETVKAIEASGGWVHYDWQSPRVAKNASFWAGTSFNSKATIDAPPWLRRLIGDDFFQDVEVVYLKQGADSSDVDVRKLFARLQRLPNLKAVIIKFWISDELLGELETTLPDCEILLGRAAGYSA